MAHNMTSDHWMLLNLSQSDFGVYSLCGRQAVKHFVRAQTWRRWDNPRLDKINRASQNIGKVLPLNPKLCLLNICPAAFVSSNYVPAQCVLFGRCIEFSFLIGMTFYVAPGKIGYFPKHMLRSFGNSGMFCAASWRAMTHRWMQMKHNGLN